MPHENTHSPVLTVFSEGEQQRFWVDDRAATRVVVTLLAGIFTIGLIGYICVSLWVNASPNFPDYYF